MALTANLTEAWRARIEAYLDEKPVYAEAITNNHYEGEVRQNRTLNILTVGNISIGTYTGADISFDTMSTTGITFTADQKKYFGFQVLDTDQQGSAIQLLNSGSERAAIAMAQSVDDYLAGLHTTITTNLYGTDAAPITVGFDATVGEVLPSVALATLQQKIAEANADQSDPRAVLPSWMASYLLQEFGVRNTVGGDSAAKVGVKIGKLDLPPIAGFNSLYVSNNVAYTAGAPNTLYKVMATGSPNTGITFAKAIENIETGRLINNFGGFVKGLLVFGAKVPYENHMALGTFNIGTARS